MQEGVEADLTAPIAPLAAPVAAVVVAAPIRPHSALAKRGSMVSAAAEAAARQKLQLVERVGAEEMAS